MIIKNPIPMREVLNTDLFMYERDNQMNWLEISDRIEKRREQNGKRYTHIHDEQGRAHTET